MTIERPDDETVRAIELAREIPLDLPNVAHREEMRTAILAASARLARRPPRARGMHVVAFGAIGAVAAAATVVMVTRHASTPVRPPPAITHRGTVHAAPGTRFTESTLPDEIVRFADGTIRLEVDPLAPGERFRVVVGDGEVEVRGTAFEVEALDDHLVSVHVDHGRVEVRPRGEAIVVLGNGEAWHRTMTARADKVAVPPVPMPPRPAPKAMSIQRPAPPPPVARPRSPEALAFDDAWTAMRASRFAIAAQTFARVVAIAPDGPLADDARFWTAVADSRGGDRAAAIVAFRAVVDRQPSSAHFDDATVMLGWLLLETGALDEAHTRFAAAENAAAAEIRTSARAGLAALATQR